MAASSTVRGQSPFTQATRAPLAELPLRAFISRPPSPVKSYSSPCKINTITSATQNRASSKASSSSNSPSRAFSLPSDDNANSRGSLLFGDVIRKSDAADVPLEESKPIESKGKARAISILASPHTVKSTSSSTSSSPSKCSKSSQSSTLSFSPSKVGPQSLGRKKDRIRRQLLDEDEEGTLLDPRATSPSPRKTSRVKFPLESTAMNTNTNTQEEASKSRLNPQGVKWEVWQGDEDQVLRLKESSPIRVMEEDSDEKENIGPAGLVTSNQGRKKGTGGRLSLLATANENSDGDQSFDFQGKRRRTIAEVTTTS